MRTTIPIILLLILVTGCGDADQKAKQAEQTITSWSSAVRFAAEQFELQQVPQQYLKQVIDAAQQELPQTRKQVEKLPESKRSSLRRRLDVLQARVAAMEQALAVDPDNAAERVGAVATTMPVKGDAP